ncbi:MAG: TonB-dependent receptor [candidate division KSB1 bacterium]|nr:TonB-dependent receptor [candidate division KSB1 bacterium]MDZ7365370.1 TonB-dependent receptor [candidate division KSB1 bacterium]MDZ7403583.1 TonB-dependent receptor [candidate division KSB1 bacterium]
MSKRFFWSTAVLLLANLAMSQNGKFIRGQITDSRTGKPLPGANIFVVPKGSGAISDAHGRFRFQAHGETADSLRISFMGYRPRTLALAEIQDELNITLEATTLLFAETVVTATRQASVRADAPSATELVEVNSPQIVARQNLGEALSNAQSVFVKEYGGVNGLKTINLRGAGEGQVLVLTDGARLNNPQSGSIDASLFSLVGIDKIEILRGNASAQYGSEAIGGVIHLRSVQPPAGFSSSLQTSAGSFGAFNSRAQLSYGSAKWRGAVALDRLVSDGDFPIDDTGKIKRQNNGSQRREIFARLSGNPHDDLSVQVLHRRTRLEQGVPGSLHFLSDDAQQKDSNHLTSIAFNWNSSPLLQLAAQFSADRRDQRYDDPDPLFPVASRHQVASDFGSLQNRVKLHQTFDLVVGGEAGHYRLTSTDLGKPERTQRSAFVQAEWQPFLGRRPGRWQIKVMPSLRYDDYSDAGHRTSPKLALGLNRESATRLHVHGSIGKSFRVPSMNDLFWPAGPFVAGNPGLLPERGREIEGGVLYEFSTAGNWQLELAGFNSKIEDLIVWISDANFRYSPVNLENAKISGVELSAAWRSHGDRLGWRANYTRLSPKNEASSKNLLYRPANKFDLNANLNLRYLNLGGSFQLVGKRFINADNSKSLPAYRVTNFSLSRQVHFGDFDTLLHVEMRNVFDKHFSIIDGYPLPGREWRATLRLGI